MDINNFILIIIMIIFTTWIWIKSINICPKSFHNEYLILTKKHNDAIKERNKYKRLLEMQYEQIVFDNNTTSIPNNTSIDFAAISKKLNNNTNSKFALYE